MLCTREYFQICDAKRLMEHAQIHICSTYITESVILVKDGDGRSMIISWRGWGSYVVIDCGGGISIIIFLAQGLEDLDL